MTKTGSHKATMQAVFLLKPGGPLIVKEVPVPEPGPSEVLVKIAAAPVNPSDLARNKNVHNDELSSFIPGLEGSGTVVAAGKGLLPALWLGKRVSCSSGYRTSGTWAEYMVTPAGNCFPLSSKVNDEQGSMSLVNPLTAIGFFEIARQSRHKAIINNAAASALGRMVELLGKKHQIPVINIVRSQKHVDWLKKMGSGHVLNSSSPSFTDELGTLAKELQATVLFDSVCSRQLEKMIEVLPAGSSVIIYGNLSGEQQIMINPRSLIDNNINISGFFLGQRAKENGMFKNMMHLIEVRGLMKKNLTITVQGRYPLKSAQEAVDIYLEKMSEGKVLLIPGF